MDKNTEYRIWRIPMGPDAPDHGKTPDWFDLTKYVFVYSVREEQMFAQLYLRKDILDRDDTRNVLGKMFKFRNSEIVDELLAEFEEVMGVHNTIDCDSCKEKNAIADRVLSNKKYWPPEEDQK